MRKLYAEFEDPDNLEGPQLAAFDITPDLADAIREALSNVRSVDPPRHARSFDELTETIAQTSRLIQHLETFRELAIVAADKTSPYADRKSISIVAAMPPSRLYRVLDKHGRPRDRRAEVLPDLGRLEQHLASIRDQAADASLTPEQREKLEQVIPKIEEQIAEIRSAQTTPDRATEK
jgi:hypothetical protein